jgi:hypothetical protein
MQANRSARSPRPVSVCSFTFADGRQCRIPRRQGHPYLCLFHAKKEAQILAGEQAGQDIASFLNGGYISACDVASALARLFSAVAQGQIKPKTAATLAYLGQTLVQTLHLAQHEYINAFGTNSWRDTVRSSFTPPPAAAPPPEHRSPNPPPAPPGSSSPTPVAPQPTPPPPAAPHSSVVSPTTNQGRGRSSDWPAAPNTTAPNAPPRASLRSSPQSRWPANQRRASSRRGRGPSRALPPNPLWSHQRPHLFRTSQSLNPRWCHPRRCISQPPNQPIALFRANSHTRSSCATAPEARHKLAQRVSAG